MNQTTTNKTEQIVIPSKIEGYDHYMQTVYAAKTLSDTVTELFSFVTDVIADTVAEQDTTPIPGDFTDHAIAAVYRPGEEIKFLYGKVKSFKQLIMEGIMPFQFGSSPFLMWMRPEDLRKCDSNWVLTGPALVYLSDENYEPKKLDLISMQGLTSLIRIDEEEADIDGKTTTVFNISYML